MVDVEVARGVAASGDPVEDMPELFREASDAVSRLGIPGIVQFLAELQEASTRDLGALSMACHEMGRTAGRVLIAAAGLPYLPTTLASARSYAERLYHYLPVDRLPEADARVAGTAPAQRLGVAFTTRALDSLLTLSDGYPYFHDGGGKTDEAVRHGWDPVRPELERFDHDHLLVGPSTCGNRCQSRRARPPTAGQSVRASSGWTSHLADGALTPSFVYVYVAPCNCDAAARVVTVPVHAVRILKPKTLLTILDQAGLTVDQLTDLL